MAKKSTKKDVALLDISGVWYNPDNSGWGILINNFGESTHSCTIFTQNAKGEQLWMTGAGNRQTGEFTLNLPKGTGAFDTLSGFDGGEGAAGTITLVPSTGVEGLDYRAEINREALYGKGPHFSPPPPAVTVFEGQVKKLG